ncbi:MAG: RNA methyltransferase [Firmicutes bacterium]|nr:RNA methyltransferase [Bacillota bacterium]
MSFKKGTAKMFKSIKALKTKKERDKEGLFVCEGLRFVEEITDDFKIKMYVASESFAQENNLDIYEKRAEVYVFTDKEFGEMSDTETPQGIMAICHKKNYSLEEIVKKADGGFYVAAEELNDPGNLGTIIRTADACGADAVILSKGSVDVYNGKVLRSTMGSVFHVPIITDVDIKETVMMLKSNGVKVYAAHLKGTKTPYKFNLKTKTAYLIGNEAKGLKEETASLADEYIKIPMPGRAESLNASVAAAVLMYETVRQREEEK